MKISSLDLRVVVDLVDALYSLTTAHWPRHEHTARYSTNFFQELVWLTAQGFIVRKRTPTCSFLSKEDGTNRVELIDVSTILRSNQDLPPEHEGYVCEDLTELDKTLRLLRISCLYTELSKFHTDTDDAVSYMFKHNESELGLQILCRNDRFFDDLTRRPP